MVIGYASYACTFFAASPAFPPATQLLSGQKLAKEAEKGNPVLLRFRRKNG
jgi:hypothetical protein